MPRCLVRKTPRAPLRPANATLSATTTGEHRFGHEEALQRVSRASDGTPLHIRADGPGLDTMDVPSFETFPGSGCVPVPAGSYQFKLQFLVYVPTATFFAQMRTAQAAQDLQVEFNVNAGDQGIERFITATRRQNFLVPPRRHRAFPLVELADPPPAIPLAQRSNPPPAPAHRHPPLPPRIPRPPHYPPPPPVAIRR